jgi:hypothetical protein
MFFTHHLYLISQVKEMRSISENPGVTWSGFHCRSYLS